MNAFTRSSELDRIGSAYKAGLKVAEMLSTPERPEPVHMCQRCPAVAYRFDTGEQLWLCRACSSDAAAAAMPERLRGQMVMMKAEDAAGPAYELIGQIAALIDAVNSLRDLVDTRLTATEDTVKALERTVTSTVARADAVLERFGRGPVGLLRTQMRRAG